MTPLKRQPTRCDARPRAAPALASTLALALAVAVPAGCASEQPVNLAMLAAAPAQPKLSPEQTLQLRVAERTLLNPSPDIPVEDRRDAAQLLATMSLPQAVEVLARGLNSGDETVILAVLAAMDGMAQPDDALLDAAAVALRDAPPKLWDALARSISRASADGLRRVVGLAMNSGQSAQSRFGAIHALSWFPSPRAAEHLASLLTPAAGEPPEIIDAACASLERLTGVQLGRDPKRWLEWWESNKHKSPADWIRDWAITLNARLVELQQQLSQERTRRDQVVTRLVETQRELFLILPKPQQVQRLVTLLGDDLSAVREFALSRIEQRLRDSEPIPEELQQKLIERLDDSVPRLRSRAAAQLDLANQPQVGRLVAEKLPAQHEAEVIVQFLTILAKRPTPAALDASLRLVQDASPTIAEAAAAAIWSLIESKQFPEERRTAVVAAARWASANGSRAPLPSVVRVLGALGDEPDIEAVTAHLESSEAPLRAAAAAGLAWRGRLEPLLAHAGDPAIHPAAVRAAEGRPADLTNFQTLVNLHPPDKELAPRWQQAVLAFAARLPAASLLEADDALSTSPAADASLRSQVLVRAVDLPPLALPDDRFAGLIVRLTQLLLELDQPARAFEAIEKLNGIALTSPQQRVQFRAAALAGKYDRAAQLEREPEPWVELLSEQIVRNAIAAAALHGEIARRFEGRLKGPALEAFQAAAALLRPNPASPQSSLAGHDDPAPQP